jgi:hypothetical protein
MATNEETNFVSGSIQTKEEKKKTNLNENGWQSVTIGGVTGILMGAGAMYAAETFATNATPDEDLTNGTSEGEGPAKEEEPSSHVATNGLKVAEVDQNLSFGDAFEAARNAVGPGGVFHWHGNIYNTYRLEEWNNMTDGERVQFAQQVQPEVQPGEGRVRHHRDVAQNDVKPEEPVKHKPEDDNKPKPEEPQKPEEPHEDGDIHFLGFTNVQVDGQDYQAGHVSAHVNGEERHVYYIDVDNAPDNEFDVAVTDRNGDGVLTSQEAFDVRENHLNVGEFALASAMEEVNQDSNQVAMVNQNDIATDMPDYVNDANTTI